MNKIAISILDDEERLYGLSVTQTGNKVLYSLPEIQGRQFLLICSFSDSVGIIDFMLKDSQGAVCLYYAENGFLAGKAILSKDSRVRIRIICPENCDGRALSGSFSFVEMTGGKALLDEISSCLNDRKKQILTCENKISILTEEAKNERYARESLQKEAIWKKYMEDMNKIVTLPKESAVKKMRAGLRQILRRFSRPCGGKE